MLLFKISRAFTILRFSNCVFVRTSSEEALIMTFSLWSCEHNGEKPVAVNARLNQWSSYADTLVTHLELSVQNYFSRLRALHNFNPLDVARSTDTSFSYALNGLGFLALVRIDFSLASLYMRTLKWHGTIVVCTLAVRIVFFLLSAHECVYVFTRRNNILHVWLMLCLP